MRTILYARVSTTDQTAAHQETQARAAGFKIDQVITDEGISGVTTPLAERPNGKRLFDILRAGDTLVVRWVDRLGRNYGRRVRQYPGVHAPGRHRPDRNQRPHLRRCDKGPDATSRAGRAHRLHGGSLSQAQAEANKEAQRAGIEHAKASDDAPYKGRKPSFTRRQYERMRDMLAAEHSVSAISKALGAKADGSPLVTRQTVYRIKIDLAWAEEVLAKWEETEDRAA